MAGRLRIPLSLVFAVVSVAAAACGSDAPTPNDAAPTDDGGVASADAHSNLFCVPATPGATCPPFADLNNQCPDGCEPVS